MDVRVRTILASFIVAVLSLTGCATAQPQAAPTADAYTAPAEVQAKIDNGSVTAINSCNRAPGQGVQVTFDDSGTPEQVKAILAKLKQLGWKGVFFPTGEWAMEHWELIQLMRSEGHDVGNHTMTHANLEELLKAGDYTAFYREIYPLKDAETTSPRLLRPPYGGGMYNADIGQRLKERGAQVCGWEADTNDWRGYSPEQQLKLVMSGGKYSGKLGPNGVLLTHLSGKYTLKFLDLLAKELDRKGWQHAALG